MVFSKDRKKKRVFTSRFKFNMDGDMYKKKQRPMKNHKKLKVRSRKVNTGKCL